MLSAALVHKQSRCQKIAIEGKNPSCAAMNPDYIQGLVLCADHSRNGYYLQLFDRKLIGIVHLLASCSRQFIKAIVLEGRDVKTS